MKKTLALLITLTLSACTSGIKEMTLEEREADFRAHQEYLRSIYE